jgi:myo-inositol 2-dehydrogenase/D-chiro-inositol 1-dehydrogenase
VKIGLIGYGAWGSYHARSITEADNGELVAIACKSEATEARARRDYPDLEVYRDYRGLLARSDVEAAVIVLPSHLHAEVAVAALKSGKHVLLEKPMALNAQECDRIIEAAERNGKQVSIGHEFRVSEQWGAVKDAIEVGAIGRPLYGHVSMFRMPYRHGAENWRYDRSRVGSWILEEPIHFFDLMLWYFESEGDPVAVSAFGNSRQDAARRDAARQDAAGLYDNFTSVLRFGSGSYAVVTQTLAAFHHHQVVEVTGTGGAIRALWSGVMDRTTEPQYSVHIQDRGGEEPRELRIGKTSGEVFEQAEQIRLTIDAFRKDEPLYSPYQGKKVVELCLAAEEALRTGAEVPFAHE